MPITNNRSLSGRRRHKIDPARPRARMTLDARSKSVAKSTSANGRGNEVRIGARLKHARLAKGYTLKQLAMVVDCSESMISKVENDKLRPSIAMLHRFSQAL